MTDKIQIELTRTQVLELISLLSSLDFNDECKPRFNRTLDAMIQQLSEGSTLAELEEASEELDALLSENYFPEIIGD